MTEPYQLTIVETSKRISDGTLTPTELLESHLERIEDLEPALRAWVTIDVARARESARILNDEAKKGRLRGPLHGIPVGIKDIYYTKGLATTMGSPIYGKFVPDYDSDIVTKLREAGTILLGKTETTEFAFLDPAPTRNPWKMKHTPGGSSSGSAAAVSASMCPLAFGSQTGGSITRPASFCGVVGVKPTYDLLSREGVFPLAWSLDHIGFITRNVKDAGLTFDVLTNLQTEEIRPKKPRIAYVQGYFKEQATEDVLKGFESALEKLRSKGAETEEIDLGKSFDAAHSAHRIIMAVEAASIHREKFRENPEYYRPNIRGLIAGGLIVPASTYLQAQRIRRIFIKDALKSMEGYDVVATPSAPTPAPLDLKTTGSASFNAPWSLAGFPTLTIPSGLNLEGLPLGLQLTAKPYEERLLFSYGAWCEKFLDIIGHPQFL